MNYVLGYVPTLENFKNDEFDKLHRFVYDYSLIYNDLNGIKNFYSIMPCGFISSYLNH